jgi:hypothetical protein
MSTNPIVDYHIVYALVLITIALTYAGNTWGLGRVWARLGVVHRNHWLLWPDHHPTRCPRPTAAMGTGLRVLKDPWTRFRSLPSHQSVAVPLRRHERLHPQIHFRVTLPTLASHRVLA